MYCVCRSEIWNKGNFILICFNFCFSMQIDMCAIKSTYHAGYTWRTKLKSQQKIATGIVFYCSQVICFFRAYSTLLQILSKMWQFSLNRHFHFISDLKSVFEQCDQSARWVEDSCILWPQTNIASLLAPFPYRYFK